jgi:hypothetical protein
MELAALQSCADLDAPIVDEAVRSVGNLRTLLAHVAEIARPEEGAPKVLMVLARLSVPVDEFQRAVLLAPQLVRPLVAKQGRGQLKISTARAAESAPPPSLEIEQEALPSERTTAPPGPDGEEALASMMPPAEPSTAPPPEPGTVPPETPSVHTRPTVPKMTAVRPEAFPSTVTRVDPRREND